ncbi:MAG: hypothetical protein IKQ75_02895 [Bacteroidales bacterium]|nr:hypothetical protein [Bacteroidales bacterium]
MLHLPRVSRTRFSGVSERLYYCVTSYKSTTKTQLHGKN